MELGWRPGRVALVAGRAIGRGRHMVRVLAGGVGAVVATRANSCARESAVIRFGTCPDRGRFMATLAGCSGRQVCRRFARSIGSVMAC